MLDWSQIRNAGTAGTRDKTRALKGASIQSWALGGGDTQRLTWVLSPVPYELPQMASRGG